MRIFLIILILIPVIGANAQSKKVRQALANSKLLERTVFGTKDSLVLEKLFARDATYTHSSGKVELRDEAIRNIVQNKSVYAKIDTLVGYRTRIVNDSVIVEHAFVARETKADGAQSTLRLNLELVWVKEKGKWKLHRRKATRIQ